MGVSLATVFCISRARKTRNACSPKAKLLSRDEARRIAANITKLRNRKTPEPTSGPSLAGAEFITNSPRQ
jgi:hypothetical protein